MRVTPAQNHLITINDGTAFVALKRQAERLGGKYLKTVVRRQLLNPGRHTVSPRECHEMALLIEGAGYEVQFFNVLGDLFFHHEWK